MSIRDTILGASDVPTELVEVPEWGTTVLIRGLTAGQMVDFYDRVAPDGNLNRRYFYPELVIACACDPETGQPVFEPADRDALLGKSAAAVQIVGQRAAALSGMAADSKESFG